MTTITGIIFLHSETGTEGGHWAIQDDKFITPAPETSPNKICQKCNRFWQDADSGTDEPAPMFSYYRPERTENGTRYMGGYFGSPTPIEDGQTTFGDEEPGSFNDTYTKRSNERALRCYNEGHEWEWETPRDSWSYKGLVYLQDGDVLTVFDKDDSTKELFTTTVKLLSNGDQYAEGAKHALGMVIHTYPDPECFEDLDEWSAYFLDSYPGKVVRFDGS